jgi:hypothetical protein
MKIRLDSTVCREGAEATIRFGLYVGAGGVAILLAGALACDDLRLPDFVIGFLVFTALGTFLAFVSAMLPVVIWETSLGLGKLLHWLGLDIARVVIDLFARITR